MAEPVGIKGGVAKQTFQRGSPHKVDEVAGARWSRCLLVLAGVWMWQLRARTRISNAIVEAYGFVKAIRVIHAGAPHPRRHPRALL